MIVVLAQWVEWVRGNRVWLASLAAAAAINGAVLGLASLAPMGRLPGVARAKIESPVEIVMGRRAPPPPDLNAAAGADQPPSAMPPRFRPRIPIPQAWPGVAQENSLPRPRLPLNLTLCDPLDEQARERPDCVPAQEWLRADRDASDLLGPQTQGYTLDEFAAARGWIKRKPGPVDRQSGMSATTDIGAPEMRGSLFKDPPFPPHMSGPQVGQ